MIKEFWQERREEKKRLKAERKANRKNPKTKEQIAYKIFGVLFALFIIFGSIGFSCTRSCSGGYSWDELIGVDEEVSSALTATVDKSILLPNGEICEVDWSACISKMNDVGIDVVSNFKIDKNKLDKVSSLSANLQLTNRQLGALIKQYIEISEHSTYIDLLDMKVSLVEDTYYLNSVILLSLKNYIGSNLPDVYLQTSSTISIYDKRCYVANSNTNVNNLDEEMNTKVLDVLDNNIFNISLLTNELIVSNINSFATNIRANVVLNESLLFMAK